MYDTNKNEILQINDISKAWRSMRVKIEKVLDQIAPVRTFKFRCTKPAWLIDDLIELMRDRDAALKRASKSKKEEDKKQARNIRNLVNQYIKRARSEYLQEQLDNLKDKPKKFWNVLNGIIDPGKQSNNFKLTDTQGE